MTKHAKAIGLGVAIVTLTGALALAASQLPLPDPNKALAQEQLKLARQALQDLGQMHKSEGLSLADPRFALWDRRQVEAIVASGADTAEWTAALENYLKRMKQLEQFAQVALQNGEINRVELRDAQYRSLEAEIWLNREKAR